MINESKKTGDPYANMIHQMNLESNQVTVLLGDHEKASETSEMTPVEINISTSAFSNYQSYYDQKKKHVVKELKT